MPFRQLLLTTSLLLSSCSFQADITDVTAEYAQRLAKVLSSPGAELSAIPPLPELPGQDISTDDVQISLKDFYQLKDCRLYSLVAERNTALGKIQASSQRYLYEIEMLEALRACYHHTENGALKEQLQYWQQQKQSTLHQQWLALLQSEEIRFALSRNRGWVESKQTDSLSETRQSLQYLLSLRPDMAMSQSSRELEGHLRQLQQARLMARVFRTQRLLDSHLSSLTLWLKAREMDCPKGNAPQHVKFLRNIFRLFFIEQIQPLASRTNDIYYQLMPRWRDLLEAHQPNSDWLNQRDREFEQYRHSLAEHIGFWQALFQRCNLSPPAANQP